MLCSVEPPAAGCLQATAGGAGGKASRLVGERCVQLRRQPGRRRACRSVKVTKHSTIPYVWYFSLGAIVTLSSRRAVFTIFDFKKMS